MENVRPKFTAPAVGTVAARAVRFVRLAAGDGRGRLTLLGDEGSPAEQWKSRKQGYEEFATPDT